MKHSEVLREARDRIEHGSESYVCNALHPAYYPTDASKRAAQLLRDWVGELIAPHLVLENWVRDQGTQVPHGVATPQARITRLAWLDWMVQHWEEIENEQVSA